MPRWLARHSRKKIILIFQKWVVNWVFFVKGVESRRYDGSPIEGVDYLYRPAIGDPEC